MHLTRLRIENFRALENIDVEFDSLVNVIIGPNAIGKTTILEAIRLAKAVLAPRTPQETNQTLQSLGATSPHMPQRLFPAALTNKPEIPLSIKCTYRLESEEIQKIKSLTSQLATHIAQQSAGLTFAAQNQIMAFISSPQGQETLKNATAQLGREIANVEQTMHLALNLTINCQTGTMAGEFPVQQIFFTALEQSLDPRKTLFSYFPADRALPIGEQQIQLGSADTSQQMESYNSQPQLKYNRLKNTIFNSIISGDKARADLKAQFGLIFGRILKGRALGEIGVNEIGMLSIPILDTDSGATFQIDGLSSGEKGLILTFLLIARDVERNGLILLDEPELHLNPAVCRDLLQFFVDEYAVKLNIKAIICSHSPQILAGAFERSQCALFHLRSGQVLAKVRQRDQGEIRDVLRRLGCSESEALLYKGTISVEGIHDVEILQAGFGDLFRRYIIKPLGGRGEVEKDIRKLQDAENRGDEIGNYYFIFDRDHKPTSLSSSEHVRLLQLDRYCLENYLLDVEILTDLSGENRWSERQKSTTTEMRDVMKALAMAQLHEVVSRSVFKDLGLEDIVFDMKIMRDSEQNFVAKSLLEQIQAMESIIGSMDKTKFEKDFSSRYEEKIKRLRPEWDDNWRVLSDGKHLLEDMRRDGHFKGDLLQLKKAVMSEMRLEKSFSNLVLSIDPIIDSIA